MALLANFELLPSVMPLSTTRRRWAVDCLRSPETSFPSSKPKQMKVTLSHASASRRCSTISKGGVPPAVDKTCTSSPDPKSVCVLRSILVSPAENLPGISTLSGVSSILTFLRMPFWWLEEESQQFTQR